MKEETLLTLFPKGKIPDTARIEVWHEAIDPPVDMGDREESLGFFKNKQAAAAVSEKAGWGDDSTVREQHFLTVDGETGFLLYPDLVKIKDKEGKEAIEKSEGKSP